MSAATPTPRAGILDPPPSRLLGVRGWDALVVLAGVLLAVALDSRGHFHAHVRLTDSRWLSAPSTVTLLAFGAIASGVVGRRHEIAGLVGLSAVSLGFAASWLLLGDHRWAGPVLLDLGRDHGVHAFDFLALVPMSLAGVLLWLAVIRSRSQRRT